MIEKRESLQLLGRSKYASNLDAIAVYTGEAQILYAPGKAANAGRR